MIRLTRRYRWPASHRLHSDALSDEQNWQLYGKCNNPYGHGHDYVLEVSVRGEVDARSGQVAHIERLDTVVQSSVLDDFAHQNLNCLPDFAGVVPTTENIASAIERRLQSNWPNAFPGPGPGDGPVLDRVRVRETRNNSFELET